MQGGDRIRHGRARDTDMSLLSLSSIPSAAETVSVAELAAHLGISKQTVYGWVKKKHQFGQLPSIRIGGRTRFVVAEVERFLAAGRPAAKPRLKPSKAAREYLKSVGYPV